MLINDILSFEQLVPVQIAHPFSLTRIVTVCEQYHWILLNVLANSEHAMMYSLRWVYTVHVCHKVLILMLDKTFIRSYFGMSFSSKKIDFDISCKRYEMSNHIF